MTPITCSTISDNAKTQTNKLPQPALTAKTYNRKWDTFFTAKNIAVITLIGFNVLLAYKCYNQQQELISKDNLIKLKVSNIEQCKTSLNIFRNHNQKNIDDVSFCKHSVEELVNLSTTTIKEILSIANYENSRYKINFLSSNSKLATFNKNLKLLNKNFEKLIKPIQHL